MDILKEAVALVHKSIEHGGSTDAKVIAAALETIGATLAHMSKGIKPVSACSAAEYEAAIKRGTVLCLECGEEVQALGSHTIKAHGMGWGEYIDRWGFWFEREGITPRKAGATLSAKRRDNALMIGLGAQGQQPKKVETPQRKEKTPRLLTPDEAFEYNTPYLAEYVKTLSPAQLASKEGAELAEYIQQRVDIANGTFST